jgi:hypothetical protein
MPMPNSAYSGARTWAAGWNVIPSKGRGDKTPKVRFGKHNGALARRLWKHEVSEYEEIADEFSSNPILLLDNWIVGRSLCVVDVDNMALWNEVVAWFLERGVDLNATYQVESGREGGGRHCYFLREAGKELKYRQQGSAKAFPPKTVDMKATGNYVIAPGAIHETGLVYQGNWPGTLQEIAERLPVMPLAVWQEAHPRPVKDLSAGRAVHDSDGPEWAEVARDGRERQDRCPWCGSTSSRVLLYNASSGYAHCFKEGESRHLKPRRGPAVAVGTTVRAEPLQMSDTSAAEWDATRDWLYAMTRYAALRSFSVPGMPDADELDLVLSGAVNAGMNAGGIGSAPLVLLENEEVPHTNGALPIATWSNALSHYTHRDMTCPRARHTYLTGWVYWRTACWNYNCPECGPRLMDGHRCAADVKLRRLMETPGLVYGVARVEGELPKIRPKGDRWWMSVSPRPDVHCLLMAWPEGEQQPRYVQEVLANPAAWWEAAVAEYDSNAWSWSRRTSTEDLDDEISFDIEIKTNRSRVFRGSENSPMRAISELRDQVVGRSEPPGAHRTKAKLILSDVPPSVMSARLREEGLQVNWAPDTRSKKQSGVLAECQTVCIESFADAARVHRHTREDIDRAVDKLIEDGRLQCRPRRTA